MNLEDYINKYAISPGLRIKVLDRKLVRLMQKSYRAKDPSTKIDINTEKTRVLKSLHNAIEEERRLDLASLSGGAKASKLGREFLDQLGRAKPRKARAIF